MKFVVLACMLAIPALAAGPADGPPEGFEHWTAASIKEASQSLKQKAASDPSHMASERLVDFSNETFMLAHREVDGKPEWHETQADVFVVESGSATLLVGGILENAETVAPHEKRNGTIQGGAKVPLGPGDVVRIPAGVPHQLLLNGSGEFNYFVVKIKGY